MGKGFLVVGIVWTTVYGEGMPPQGMNGGWREEGTCLRAGDRVGQ